MEDFTMVRGEILVSVSIGCKDSVVWLRILETPVVISPLIHATTLRRPLPTFSLILQLFTRSSIAETSMAATTLSPSSSAPRGNDDRHIPSALALPAVVATATHRLPPPCWSPNETTILIDAYRDKWYSLRRNNLRANHWNSLRCSNLRCAAPTHPRRPSSSAATRWRSSASGTALDPEGRRARRRPPVCLVVRPLPGD
ncbi:sequence-specific DNA binding transcription factors [Striga asiatica]|uniref:Sequence-specific DNA binding transcription factors n=1 Tax=Striga asiatica TaxID=4170 RepID=A0A5A7PBE5_STRAF|nr:sequence-specific DNA binding transcription factors [Striga asiatica]